MLSGMRKSPLKLIGYGILALGSAVMIVLSWGYPADDGAYPHVALGLVLALSIWATLEELLPRMRGSEAETSAERSQVIMAEVYVPGGLGPGQPVAGGEACRETGSAEKADRLLEPHATAVKLNRSDPLHVLAGRRVTAIRIPQMPAVRPSWIVATYTVLAVAFVLSWNILGTIPASGVFCMVALVLLGERRAWLVIVVPVVLSSTLYIAFQVVLYLPFPAGIF